MPPKVKFFFSLACHGRLWTAERCEWHGLQHDAAYVLCDQHDETTDDHFLASCVSVFTREIWHRLLRTAGLQHLVPLARLVAARTAVPKIFEKLRLTRAARLSEHLKRAQPENIRQQGKDSSSVVRANYERGGRLDRCGLSVSCVADRHSYLEGSAINQKDKMGKRRRCSNKILSCECNYQT